MAETARRRLTNRSLFLAASLIFLAGTLLFALHFQPLPGAIVVLGSLGAAALIAREPAPPESLLGRPVDLRRLGLCLLAALALLIIGGEGHLLFANADWLMRDAVLADMARTWRLPEYAIDGAPYILRAPLGMYVIPALAGNAFGLVAAHAVLVAQNTLLLGLLLYFLSLLASGRGALVVAMVLAFSGLDIVGTMLSLHLRGIPISFASLPSHLEDWAVYWQYSSLITQLFWVPNHALPGWWLAILILMAAEGEASCGALGLTIALTAFWSPLTAIGAVPFALLLIARRWRALLTDRRFWLSALAAAALAPIAAYIVLAWTSIQHAPLWNDPGYTSARIPVMGIFLILELPQLIVLGLEWRRLPARQRRLLICCAAVLAILPWVVFGPGNDLVMRGSIPALMIIAVLFSEAVANDLRHAPGLRVVAILLLVIGAVTPGFEIWRAVSFPRYAISTCNLAEAQRRLSYRVVTTNYMAPVSQVPGWLMAPSAGAAPLTARRWACWPDYPFNPRLSVGGFSASRLLRARRVLPEPSKP